MFNLFGLLNTPKDNSIYRIKAMIGADYTTEVDSVDWNASNQR